ncbi:GrpB family protein [Myroides odoratimimus]|uniref:GrpB family protein n=1 Tax=Myroides odoratimimus TaxID=76832 RepID=UPI000724E505|nr:GrpB family protein [Myroides odoratimimus]MDM1094400.1 GrpB family protein [Myroides odoratimimus]MDM1327220.1 GrpB family protein [Myroides odoratimimus]MDM1463226.1 GrpB family protein [Myroides odoratimimus]MDM1468437.1 GrpB family protein [Myroides odoratimimus]MDM1471670.1 GrpB family protein [Myroides odoratimimus]
MKVAFEKYNPQWREEFDLIKGELAPVLNHLEVQIEHIGSTSVEGLSAKPIIDIMIGLKSEEDLDKLPSLMTAKGYIYYELYNEEMPYRRFFVKLDQEPSVYGFPTQIGIGTEVPEGLHNHDIRVANIHAIPVDNMNWTRHIAFRDYLRAHPAVKKAYQELKEKLSTMEWRDGNHYNEGKDSFIKTEEAKAIKLFLDKKK